MLYRDIGENIELSINNNNNIYMKNIEFRIEII